MNFFDATSYREIINNEIARNSHLRGYKKKLSESGGFHAAYLSQVLAGTANLTPDQASLLCEFWNYDDRMAEFFIALVTLEKASTDSLKARIARRLTVLKSLSATADTIVKNEVTMEQKNAEVLFSSCEYFAVLASLALPEVKTETDIANVLKIHPHNVRTILGQLQEMGASVHEDGTWRPSDPDHKLFAYSRNLTFQLVSSLYARFSQSYVSGYQSLCHVSVVPVKASSYNALKTELQGLIHKYINHEEAEGEFVAGVNFALFRF